ncbi:MAG: hypothetical protein H8F28_07840 [Fibrella sp.]|nr:hypothetical protein [Armatimonadota bacterium]
MLLARLSFRGSASVLSREAADPVSTWHCMPMPHHFDAFKMADSVGVSRRRLFGAICIGTVLGLIPSFSIAPVLWRTYGTEAKAELCRTSQGRVPFDNLAALLRNPVKPDIYAIDSSSNTNQHA